MQSHMRKVYACLAVTCHLHFWQNDRDLLLATVGGTVDAEIKVPSVKNPELTNVLPLKQGVSQNIGCNWRAMTRDGVSGSTVLLIVTRDSFYSLTVISAGYFKIKSLIVSIYLA